VLPLQFPVGESAQSLGLRGHEVFDITGLDGGASPAVSVVALAADANPIRFKAPVRIDTPKEREYFRHGGILQYVLRQLAAPAHVAA